MFKFKLQSVLSLKEQLEDAKKRELGIANNHKKILEIDKQTVLDKEQEILITLTSSSKNKIDLKMIKESRCYSKVLKDRKVELEEKIGEAEKIVQLKREELIEAMKEKKILDNLKEIKKQEHLIYEKKQEEKQVDEVVSYKYTKNGRSEN